MIEFVVRLDDANDIGLADPTNWGEAKIEVKIGSYFEVHSHNPLYLRAFEGVNLVMEW